MVRVFKTFVCPICREFFGVSAYEVNLWKAIHIDQCFDLDVTDHTTWCKMNQKAKSLVGKPEGK